MIQNIGAFTRNTEFCEFPLRDKLVECYGAVIQALFPCVYNSGNNVCMSIDELLYNNYCVCVCVLQSKQLHLL